MTFDTLCTIVSRVLTVAILVSVLAMAYVTHAQESQPGQRDSNAVKILQAAVRINALVLRDTWYGGTQNTGHRLAARVVEAASVRRPCKPRHRRALRDAVARLIDYTNTPHAFEAFTEEARVSAFPYAAEHAMETLFGVWCPRRN